MIKVQKSPLNDLNLWEGGAVGGGRVFNEYNDQTKQTGTPCKSMLCMNQI